MSVRRLALFVSIAALAVACAPATTTTQLPTGPCLTAPAPTVAVIEFSNTTGRRGGVTVLGAESAATARMITLLLQTGCYEVVERSELGRIMARQGLESTQAEAIAQAAGAAYVVTGAVTRATFAEPRVQAFRTRIGATQAQVEVDVRVTDVATGRVVVSMTGVGSATNPRLAISAVPRAGTIGFDDRSVGPILADASSAALVDVVAAIRRAF